MSSRKWRLGAALLGLCMAASAGTITDPAMGMDAGSLSTGLGLFTGFTPDQVNGGGILDLFNDTGQQITSIDFQVKNLKLDLSTDFVASNFMCNGAANPLLPNPFFLTCSQLYSPGKGTLDFIFTGGDGIAPLAPGCTPATADNEGCTGQGHFVLTFNDNFDLRGNFGGWVGNNSVLFTGPPVIVLEDDTTQSVPEPSTLPIAGAGVALLAAAIGRRRLFLA